MNLKFKFIQFMLCIPFISCITNKYQDQYSNYLDLNHKNQIQFTDDLKNTQTENHDLYESFVTLHRDYRERYHHTNSTEFFLFHRSLVLSFYDTFNLDYKYWDISKENMDFSIIENCNSYGIFCSHNICFQRFNTHQRLYLLVSNSIIDYWIESMDDIHSFSHLIEYDLHDKFHMFMGGTFDTENSARDILFWPYHLYIDYIFRSWETYHNK